MSRKFSIQFRSGGRIATTRGRAAEHDFDKNFVGIPSAAATTVLPRHLIYKRRETRPAAGKWATGTTQRTINSRV